MFSKLLIHKILSRTVFSRLFLIVFLLRLFSIPVIARDLLKPDGIVLHGSTCRGPAGISGVGKDYIRKNCHFLVTRGGKIVAINPENRILPHMGGLFRARSLSVLVEGEFDRTPRNLPSQQEKALQKLLFTLMEKHKIPLSQIERHIDSDEERECPGTGFPYFQTLYKMAGRMIVNAGNTQLEIICRRKKIQLPLRNARIEVTKSTKTMELYGGNKLLKTYRIGLSRKPSGDKLKKGDLLTPVGSFFISEKYPMRAWMELSYPDTAHARIALQKGVIDKSTFQKIAETGKNRNIPVQKTAMGDDVGIHAGGFPYGRMRTDSTAGCISMEDPEAFELYYAVPPGSQVIIRE